MYFNLNSRSNLLAGLLHNPKLLDHDIALKAAGQNVYGEVTAGRLMIEGWTIRLLQRPLNRCWNSYELFGQEGLVLIKISIKSKAMKDEIRAEEGEALGSSFLLHPRIEDPYNCEMAGRYQVSETEFKVLFMGVVDASEASMVESNRKTQAHSSQNPTKGRCLILKLSGQNFLRVRICNIYLPGISTKIHKTWEDWWNEDWTKERLILI